MRNLWRTWGFTGLLLALALAVGLGSCGAPSGVAVTATMTPIFSQLPTATPLATPSDAAGQALLGAARAAVGQAAHTLDVAYDVATQNLTIIITITGIPPNTDAAIAAAYARVKRLSFQEMRGVWTSGQPLKSVTVEILGPAQDPYDTIYPQDYSVAILTASTAQHVPWASATPDSAWALYDTTFLRPSFTVPDAIPPAVTVTPAHS